MSIIQYHYLELLKEAVITKAGLSLSDKADCLILREKIRVNTNRHVSEISLQRIYGLSPGKFSPSLHTLDVLADYCNAFDWEQFNNQNKIRKI